MKAKNKKTAEFSISITRSAVESIFDECDKYDVDETGGRLLGTYRHKDGHYNIQVTAVLDPGPKAERSPTYFMQDGEYQEQQFRIIEAANPDIEHLGNWHTHHVNGLQTLSGGDKDTYLRIVNHKKHNTDFFYALLVVTRNRGDGPRYTIKHFIFRRGDRTFYELPHEDVQILDASAPGEIGPRDAVEAVSIDPRSVENSIQPNPERAKDQEFFTEFYPSLKMFVAKDIGAPYWRGPLTLVDGGLTQIVAIEDAHDKAWSYSIGSTSKNQTIVDLLGEYKRRKFKSAREAVIHLERDLNMALYREKKG